jgi:succinyl-CoA synthetase beta subunit
MESVWKVVWNPYRCNHVETSLLELILFSGLTESQAEKVAEKLGLGGDKKARTVDMLFRLYDLFVKKDALLIEVNPYAEDTEGNCK